MRANTLFWGVVLVVIGGLFLLSNLGVLQINIGAIFFPTLLILFGLSILLNTALRGSMKSEHASVPLEGASEAHILLKHGAGRLRLFSGASAGNLLEGDFDGGLNMETRRSGQLLNVVMSIPSQIFGPFSFGPGFSLDWSVGVARDVPLRLELETGANDAIIDLADLLVRDLRLSSGASSTEITMPSHAGFTQAKISTGAASVKVRIPADVAVRIVTTTGLGSVTVDTARFPAHMGGYESPDFATAQNKVDMNITTGVGSVEVTSQ
jgi:hypothetical protein